MNRGSFVRGGVQHSALKEKEGTSESTADNLQQYKTTTAVSSDEKTKEYEKKIKEAGEKLAIKSTEEIIKAAIDRQTERRDRWKRQAQEEEYYRQRDRHRGGY